MQSSHDTPALEDHNGTKAARTRSYPVIEVSLVRGIRLLPIEEGQPRQFGCEWSYRGKRPETHIRAIKQARAKLELDILPTREELKEWRTFKLGAAGVPAMTILVEWRAMRENLGKPICSMTVADAVTEYLDEQSARQRRGSISKDTLRQKRCKLKQFAEAFASVMLDAITPKDIEAWIDGLKQVNTDATFNDYRKRIGELFPYFADQVPKNPIKRIEVRGKKTAKSDRHNVRLYSVDVTRSILNCAARSKPYLLPRLAAEIFFGLRFTTAALIQREHISEKSRLLDIPADIMKTRKDHLIDEGSAAYWAWAKLGLDDSRCWSMSQSDYMHHKSELLGAAGIKDADRRRNALRKGFASYHLAAFSKPGLTAKIMAHKNEGQLWSTYREKATKAAGLRLFKLRPTVSQKP